jgi:hypothetical protein
MRWPTLAVVLVGCGATPGGGGNVTLTLDIPNAQLDPKGYSFVDVTLHLPSGDLVRTASVVGNSFDLGDIDPVSDVWAEATLRTESGSAVGYGRTAQAFDLTAGANITVPVRRPILYFSGLVSTDPDGNPMTMNDQWSEVPATFSDLSVSGPLDGHAVVGSNAVLMVGSGPDLFEIQQATSNPMGVLMGPATVAPISTGDHSVKSPLAGSMQGGVLDGAGTDDGAVLVIGTSTQLFVVNTMTGAAMSVAPGSFSRVAVVNHGDGTATALAINMRSSTTGACGTNASIVSVDIANGMPGTPKTVATGGFADVAADRGHGYYIDDCKGELGEVTASGLMPLRTGLGKPTALAVSNGQAWFGVENGGVPAQIAILVAPVGAGETGGDVRTLWQQDQQQVVEAAPPFPAGIQRSMDATTAVFNHFEIGAGGDYLAVSIASTYHGARATEANFPQMDIETEELRVFDASSGGAVQWYRSWCDGSFLIESINDIDMWACATSVGQTEPSTLAEEHRIGSLSFLFGKK